MINSYISIAISTIVFMFNVYILKECHHHHLYADPRDGQYGMMAAFYGLYFILFIFSQLLNLPILISGRKKGPYKLAWGATILNALLIGLGWWYVCS